jgi:acetoacetate decarboxylase
MEETDVRERAVSMPFACPAYPRGPYRFNELEYLIIAL